MLWAGVFTVLGLGLLLKLGFWQLDRLEWKRGILHHIAEGMKAAPVPLSTISDPAAREYARVCASGTFLNDKEIHIFAANLAGEGGYHIYTPLIRKDALPVFVDRGWVPEGKLDPTTREEGQLKGQVEVCGILRLERKPGWFTLDNDMKNNIWTHRDFKAMAAFAGFKDYYPGFIEADGTPNPGGFPVGGQTFVDIPNNHLGYAITWFGLAVALVGVYGVFVFSALRDRK